MVILTPPPSFWVRRPSGVRFRLNTLAAPMDVLIIQQDHPALPSEIIAALREELIDGGIRSGIFYIGGVHRLPETIYFLWHLPGEIPISTILPRDAVSHPMLARIAIQEFLIQWNHMVG